MHWMFILKFLLIPLFPETHYLTFFFLPTLPSSTSTVVAPEQSQLEVVSLYCPTIAQYTYSTLPATPDGHEPLSKQHKVRY